MNGKNLVALILSAFAALVAEGMATNVWLTTTANTPLTAYDWTDGANWKNKTTGLTGTAPADFDSVQITRGTSPYFVKLPDEVKLAQLTTVAPGNCDTNCLLLGEKLVMGDHTKSFCYYNWIFADVYTRREGDVNDFDTWFANCHVAGRLIAPHADSGDTRGYVVPASGYLFLRLDRFATSSNPLRTDDLQIPLEYMMPGNASFKVKVEGADASTSAWKLTADSPYVQAVGECAPVAVGATVTGEGIPAGTWVRRRLAETGWLELSQAATASSDSTTLSFAAFHPDARLSVTSYGNQGSYESFIALTRAHEADALSFEITRLVNPKTAAMRWAFGEPMSGPDAALLPGKLILHTIFSQRGANPTLTHLFYNSHVELAGTATGDTVFDDNCLVGFGDTGSVARVTVPAGKTAVINTFTNFNGVLVKDGPGTLRIGLADGEGQGGITVEEGSLELSALASAGTEPIVFKGALAMTGGTLVIPEQGLVFATASFSSTATVRGPGRVFVTDSCNGGATPVLEGGALIRYGGNAAAGGYVHDPVAEVAGHPAFWVDASKRDTFVLENENGVDYVRRWNDWRAGEPMFATNITRRPVLHWGEEMTNKYVKITRVDSVTNNAETEGLVWSVPIDCIRAVFMVHDPVDGGGALLGRTSRLRDSNYGSQGGPFYLSGGTVIASSYATDRVKYGRFFRDGEEFVAYETKHVKVPQVMEFHANTSYWAKPGNKEELICDAFGIGSYRDMHMYNTDDGRQRLSEVLIYTNSLTHAERVQTALYLSRKWLGKDIYYSDVETSVYNASSGYGEGEGVTVPAGAATGIRSLEGGGPLVKDGGGTLIVEAMKAGDVRVEGGELLVKSMSFANSALPANAWTHMDAQAAASVTRDGEGRVSRWTSTGGDAQSYQPVDANAPLYRIDSTTGKPMVDCGTFNASTAAALRLHQADDATYLHDNDQENYISTPYIRAAFIVCSSAGGGGSLLGSWGNGYPWQGIPFDGSANTLTMPLVNNTYRPWGNDGASLSITNGGYTVRCNSEAVNAFEKEFSGGVDIFTFAGGFARKSDHLACFGQSLAKKGGLAYGEVLLYTNRLDEALLPKVEAVLREKWFDEGTAGIGARRARCDSLFVAAGARLTVSDWAFIFGGDAYEYGTGVITTGALGGGGTVEGCVKVSENGKILAEVEDGAMGALTVNGSLELPSELTVKVSGDTATLEPGVYTLVENAGIVEGAVTTWHVEVPAKPHRVVRPFVENGAIKAEVFARGMIFSFR